MPVILKPLDANHGNGISSRVDDERALRTAWEHASIFGRRVVVENFVSGRDYRVLVVNGTVIAAAERVPAHVIGDGTSTIRALIEHYNQDARRGVGHTKVLTRLPDDTVTIGFFGTERAHSRDDPHGRRARYVAGDRELVDGRDSDRSHG